MTRILFHSPCGGTGTTTVMANTGVALARSGQSVLLQSDDSSIAHHFSLSPRDGDQTNRAVFPGVKKSLLEPNLYLSEFSVKALPVSTRGPVPISARQLNPVLSDEFMLVEDRGCSLREMHLLADFDILNIVIKPDATSFAQLPETIDHLCTNTLEGIGLPKINFLINAYSPESPLSQDLIVLLESTLGDRLFHEHLLSDESARQSVAMGIPLADFAPYSPVTLVMQAFALHLMKQSRQLDEAA